MTDEEKEKVQKETTSEEPKQEPEAKPEEEFIITQVATDTAPAIVRQKDNAVLTVEQILIEIANDVKEIKERVK